MIRPDLSPFQGTVAQPVTFAGVGLHTGKMVSVEVRPAAPHTGIQFLRSDLQKSRPILAHPERITSTTLCTTIGYEKGPEVATIEHLMAAFAGLGIDNAFVHVNACEIPILDGSSAPFVDKLNEVGVQIQGVRRAVLIPDRVITVSDGDQFVRLEPLVGNREEILQNPRLYLSCHIDFARSQAIGQQECAIEFSRYEFMRLCEARTFCHVDDVTVMRQQGLALGGSLDNAVVVDDHTVLNHAGLRCQDEFVRHKLLDCIGDLALLGARLTGHLTLHKAGHTLHAKLTQKLLRELHASQVAAAWGPQVSSAKVSSANCVQMV